MSFPILPEVKESVITALYLIFSPLPRPLRLLLPMHLLSVLFHLTTLFVFPPRKFVLLPVTKLTFWPSLDVITHSALFSIRVLDSSQREIESQQGQEFGRGEGNEPDAPALPLPAFYATDFTPFSDVLQTSGEYQGDPCMQAKGVLTWVAFYCFLDSSRWPSRNLASIANVSDYYLTQD